MRLLYVEDEKGIAEPLKKALEKRGYAVDWVEDGMTGLNEALVNDYDCILLDLNLPGISGLELARTLRKEENTIPILMLTARTSQENKYEGFDAGTDDYLTKPFEFKELLYRIEALIRRNSSNKSTSLKAGDVEIDEQLKMAKLNGQIVELNNKEYGILLYLLRNKGKVVSQEELLEHVWDREINMFTDTVRTNIKTLRQKVDSEKTLIKTQRGRGYVIH